MVDCLCLIMISSLPVAIRRIELLVGCWLERLAVNLIAFACRILVVTTTACGLGLPVAS